MRYIKRQSTSLLLALASLSVVSSSLVSCSESAGMSGVTLSDKKISFTATEVNGWMPNSGSSNDETTRAMSTVGSYRPLIVKSDLGKPLYLHPVEQVGTYFYNDKDELVTHSGVPLSEINNQNSISTRGTKVTEIGDEILVSAVSKKDNVEAGYFSFERAKKNGNIWHILNDKYWATDATLSFYAYAPTNASMLSTSDSGLSGYRTVHYVAGTGDDIKSQPDFIVAKSEDNQRSATDAASAVDLHFSHALTAVTFSVGSDMAPGYVKSVAIHNVKGEGDYDFSSKTENPWTTNSTLSDYTIKLGTDDNGILVTTGKSMALTYDPMTLMMIPQSFSDGKAEVELVFNDGVSDHHLFATLANDWKPGYTVNYKLSSSDLNTLNIGSIVFPTNWSSQYTTTANKLKSSYTNNDQIGLFVVDETGHLKYANIPVTYNSNTHTWSLPSDKEYLFYPMYHYFAYYPYQESLSGMPAEGSEITISGDDDKAKAVNFFSDVIDNWKPVSDQSDLDKLNKYDLQIGMANLSSDASSFDFNTMLHAMGLADINLSPGLNYELSDKTYSWTSAMVNDQFEGDNIPYKITYNNYIAIVNPRISTSFNVTKSKDWKSAWKNPLSFKPNINDIEKLTAQRTSDENQPYTLTLGDIYYKNGAITHNNEDLEPAAANTPIGVVGYIAKGDDDYWVEKNTKADGIGGHGLVICLKTIGSTGALDIGTRMTWGANGSVQSANPMTNLAKVKASKSNEYGSGYKRTIPLWEKSSYPAFYAVYNYNKNAGVTQTKSTGWFLPTAGQYYAVISGWEGTFTDAEFNSFFRRNGSAANVTRPINDAMAKVGNTNYTEFFGSRNTWAITSSEYSSQCDVILDSGMDDGYSYGALRFSGGDAKTGDPRPVRPFLAF